MYEIDFPGERSSGDVSESEESLEHSEQSSDGDMNDDQEGHAEENVDEEQQKANTHEVLTPAEIQTEDEETDPVAPEEAPARVTRNPADPTPEERSRHDLTHLPYRPWCPICVEARAVEDPHYRLTEEERSQGYMQICADYCEIGEDENDKDDKRT